VGVRPLEASITIRRVLLQLGRITCSSIIFLLLPAFFVYSSSTFCQTNDPYYSSQGSWNQQYDDQWALKAIGFLNPNNKKSAWSLENGTKNPVIVAVIDTGIDFHHPDLARETIWLNHNETANGIDDDGNGYIDDMIGWNFVDNDNNPWDFAGHGTHIAGLIGASTNNGEGIAGINWGVKIMPLKVMNFTGRGRAIRLAEAIFYAVKHGAKVINLSLGTQEKSSILQDAVNYANKHGALVVVAAGNSAVDAGSITPAGLANVITVASTNPDGSHAGFSNWGDAIDIAAPGVDILSLRARRTDFALIAGQVNYQAGDGNVGSDKRYYRATGTSFSAPLVSGVASLIFAKYPEAKASEVKKILLQNARDIHEPGIDRHSGYGMVDAYAALAAKKDFFIDARIDGVAVVQQGGKPLLRITGTADANSLRMAWIEIGEGDSPEKWKKVGSSFKQAVHSGILADLDVNLFRSSKVWTLRLVSKHKDGKTREARFVLRLG